MRRYSVGKITESSLTALWRLVDIELRRIASVITFNAELRQTALTVEPLNPSVGQLAYADGENWNPGGGEGTYEYTSNGWVKLGNTTTAETVYVSGVSGTFEITTARRYSGSAVVKVAETFTQEQIGLSVFVQQKYGTDEDEFCQLHCVGEVKSKHTLRIRWIAVGGAASGVKHFRYFLPL